MVTHTLQVGHKHGRIYDTLVSLRLTTIQESRVPYVAYELHTHSEPLVGTLIHFRENSQESIGRLYGTSVH